MPQNRMLQSRYWNGWFDSPELLRLYDKDIHASWNPARTYLLRVGLPPDIDPESVRYLSLYESYPPDYLTSVPPYLKTFTKLEGLHLPSYTLEAATPGNMPTANLRYLTVYGDNFSLPHDLYFPRLEELSTAWLECHFRPENVPALRTLGTELDRRGRVLAAIASLPSLQVLTIGKVRNEATYQAIARLGLEHLGMSPIRTFRSLHGIEQLTTLQTLNIVDFKRVDTIEPLAKLPLLEEIFFHDCKGLPSLAPLAMSHSLRSLIFLGCGPLQWAGAKRLLASHFVHIDDAFSY